MEGPDLGGLQRASWFCLFGASSFHTDDKHKYQNLPPVLSSLPRPCWSLEHGQSAVELLLFAKSAGHVNSINDLGDTEPKKRATSDSYEPWHGGERGHSWSCTPPHRWGKAMTSPCAPPRASSAYPSASSAFHSWHIYATACLPHHSSVRSAGRDSSWALGKQGESLQQESLFPSKNLLQE